MHREKKKERGRKGSEGLTQLLPLFLAHKKSPLPLPFLPLPSLLLLSFNGIWNQKGEKGGGAVGKKGKEEEGLVPRSGKGEPRYRHTGEKRERVWWLWWWWRGVKFCCHAFFLQPFFHSASDFNRLFQHFQGSIFQIEK